MKWAEFQLERDSELNLVQTAPNVTYEIKKQNEEKAKFLEQQEADIANQEFELSIQDQSLLKQEIAKALREAEEGN